MRRKKPVPNPHDAFFRRTFSHPLRAAEFLRLYLPKSLVALLDLSRLTIEDTSFVDQELREHYSDLLWRVGLKGGGDAFIYILLEHKSAPEERTPLQLLRYLAQGYDRLALPLPLIVPVVIYHGAAPWRVGRRLRDLFGALAKHRVLRRFLPDFESYLCDLSRLADRRLKGKQGLAPVLHLLKYIFRRELPDKLPELFVQTARDLSESEARELIRTMIAYLNESHRVSEQQIGQAMRRAITEGENMENIVDKWERQWMQTGIADLALHQLHQLLGPLDRTTEKRIRSLPGDKLIQLGGSLLGFKSAEDLDEWLQSQAPPPKPARRRARK